MNPPAGRPTGVRDWPLHRPPDHRVVWTRALRQPSDLPGARARLRQHLRAAGHARGGDHGSPLGEAAERIVLVAEEMTSNGVRHGNPPVGLSLALTDDPASCLLVVTDRAGARPPTPDPDRDPAHGGLGLLIVATYATDHGWWPDGATKHVWAALPTS